MKNVSGGLKEWIYPLAFVLCAGWVIWHIPAFLLDYFPHDNPSTLAQVGALEETKDVTPNLPGLFGGRTDIIDWIALILMPVTFVLGMRSMVIASMEFEFPSKLDTFAMFIGRITMILIISMTMVMLYEVLLRYLFQNPTLWANELTLWIAGFVFMLSGLYAMQQRSHIRIFILYDVMPRWAQHICDTLWVTLLCTFAFFMVFGSYKQVFIVKFYRWETFGTAFDPPLPATIQPMILIIICMISLQAIANLIADWNKDPADLLEKDVIDQEELEAIKKSVGAS
ncbi:MAG: TRAP transporter small permease subunit [Nitratireductor sp.]